MWPAEYIELKYIEDLLVCGICYEYMETSVITSCSHNYCSLCIRKYLHFKTQCPSCFAETFERDLRRNKVLDEIIAQFSLVKDKLKRCLRVQLHVVQTIKEENAPLTPKSVEVNKNNVNSIKKENKAVSNNATLKSTSSPSTPSTSVHKDFSSPSTSGKPKIPLIFTPKSSKRPVVPVTEDIKVVICPVCKVTISEANINRHLDDCLKRETIKDRPQVAEQKRKPLPKLVFSLMKDTAIRKKLKEFGLSSQGDRKVMEARLQRYIVLYNAECDKSNPRSVSDLLKLCEEEENLEKRINKTSSFINRLQVNRNTEQNVIEDARKKYLEAHKDSFATLIRNIKHTGTSKRSPTSNKLDDSVGSNEAIPTKRQAVVDDSNDSIEEPSDFRPINYDDIDIPDSDSDNACPLQTYSSMDSKKIVSVSSSNSNVIYKSPDQKMQTNQKHFESYYSPVKTERDDFETRTHLSDVSVLSNKNIQSIAETTFQEDIVQHDFKGLCTPKNTVPVQRRGRMNRTNEIRRIDSVSSSVGDLKFQKVLKREEIEDDRRTPISPDIMYDMSSNDSIDSKYNYERQYVIEHGALNNSRLNLSNIEKENISSSPECSANRSFRKRSRDSVQNDNKALSTKKKIRTSSKTYFSETEESNNEEHDTSILHDNENTRLRKKTRSRKQKSNATIENDTTVIRKSTRNRVKTILQ